MSLEKDHKDAHTVVLVEGDSDRNAVLALAHRLGRDLPGEGISVLAMGGATNVRQFVDRYGPDGLDLKLAGLCDQGEIGFFERALREAGLLRDAVDLEAVGFFTCDDDLEADLIRAIGIDGMLRFIDTMGELRGFRIMQRQPAQRERTVEQQLHRFVGVRSGRKKRYGGAMIDELDLSRIPQALEKLVQWV